MSDKNEEFNYVQSESSTVKKIKLNNSVNIVTGNVRDEQQLSSKLKELEINGHLKGEINDHSKAEIIKVRGSKAKESESPEKRILATEPIEAIVKKIVESGIDLTKLTPDEILAKLGGYVAEHIGSRSFPPSTILFITFNNSVFFDNQEELQQRLEPLGIQPIFKNYPDHQERHAKEVTNFVIKCAVNSWMEKKKFSVMVSADQEYPTSIITSFLGNIRFWCDKNSVEIIVARFGVYKESKGDIEKRCYFARANDTIFSNSLEPESTEIIDLIVLYLYKFVSINATEFIIDLCNDAKNDHANHGFCACYFASVMIDNEIWSSVEHYGSNSLHTSNDNLHLLMHILFNVQVQAQRFTDEEIRTKIRKAPTSNEALLIVQANSDLQRNDWNDEFRLQLISKAVSEKYIQHSPLRYKLLATSANEFKLTYANLSSTENYCENERLKECVGLASMQESDLAWYNNLLLDIRKNSFEREVLGIVESRNALNVTNLCATSQLIEI
ncbi:2655_t:CDS:2 [Ambispora gerdemannii]|uniref:2655_t:CDS:1 n=1 Tax=Ambispora gerdemannii TaxID=144530 RepID=A0A9N9AYF6_9GLOM|nr:2655_t:CDS:2 [Ambispora gerdemannii]